jgi:uncharacterized damage-inducible protein DinB
MEVGMRVRVGLENGFEGWRSIAWALDFPGAFAYGKDGSEAIMNLPQALINFAGWANRHAGSEWVTLNDFDVRLEETWAVYNVPRGWNPVKGNVEINAWFRDDWRPLSRDEAMRGVEALRWSREDLLKIVSDLETAKMDEQPEGERWSIRGILAHVATAEWWYLDRFGLIGPRNEMSKDPYERLAAVRQKLEQGLPELAGVEKVLGLDGEFWSPRKLLRRALWHELDHIGHIAHLL